MAKKDSNAGKAPAASKVKSGQALNLGGAPTETQAADQPAQTDAAKSGQAPNLGGAPTETQAADQPAQTDAAKSEQVPLDSAAPAEVAAKVSEVQPDPEQPGQRYRVTAKIDGFRRAGRPWSKDGVEVSADEFSSEQLALLMGEPNLIVEEID